MRPVIFTIIALFSADIAKANDRDARIVKIIAPYIYNVAELPKVQIVYEIPSLCYEALTPQVDYHDEDRIVKIGVPLNQTRTTCSQVVRMESQTVELSPLAEGFYRLIADEGRTIALMQVNRDPIDSYADIHQFADLTEAEGTVALELRFALHNSCEIMPNPQVFLVGHTLTILPTTETFYDSTCEPREIVTSEVYELPYQSEEVRALVIKSGDGQTIFASRDPFTNEWVLLQSIK